MHTININHNEMIIKPTPVGGNSATEVYQAVAAFSTNVRRITTETYSPVSIIKPEKGLGLMCLSLHTFLGMQESMKTSFENEVIPFFEQLTLR